MSKNSHKIYIDLTPPQQDGEACIRCGTRVGAMKPMGYSQTGSQVFACKPDCRKNVIVCPDWCVLGLEHSLEDTVHCSEDIVLRPGLCVTMVVDGGLATYEVILGDHAKMRLDAEEAARLIGALSKLMAEDTRGYTYTKRVKLAGER